jgi:hypothetical protein
MVKAQPARENPESRIAALQNEIHKIDFANRLYWSTKTHSHADNLEHARRKERLEQVRQELDNLLQGNP